MWFITLLLLIFILGIIILVHEFGHFITAKKSGVHIYEFSIGMGPVIRTHKGKDGIDYNIRAFPIGGFVAMAGEVYEDDGKISPNKFLCNKPWYQRIMILGAGVFNNFVMAFVFLFFIAMIWGTTPILPKVGMVQENSAAEEAGLLTNDEIIQINGHKVTSWDVAQIYLYYKNDLGIYDFKVLRDGKEVNLEITPKTVVEDDTERKVFGFQIASDSSKGILTSLKYAWQKFWTIVHSMVLTLSGLFTGNLSIKALSGPVGMYQVVGESIQHGISQIMYLIALLSINVGFLNILPFPAFDGGRIFFMIIEKIKGSKINSKLENTMNNVGFILLMLLMIYITFQDILNLF
ncbi:MAG: RIP metalloprotease RseP [Bacilli bacterium]|jgi:regulator of sigma E protease|nr:RIP metalloprotease RseP [Bacilli bacterium]